MREWVGEELVLLPRADLQGELCVWQFDSALPTHGEGRIIVSRLERFGDGRYDLLVSGSSEGGISRKANEHTSGIAQSVGNVLLNHFS